ncbi:MAG: response regulator [Fuerstiella sp.]|nr:response regulator [Fuerstiella sp.]MCP4854370.1 response regulator [Fuerstiella sp.]
MNNHRRMVLHIDDDPQILEIVGRKLRRRGIEVLSLTGPENAIETLLRTGCRVVLLDIDMPHANGLDVLKEIKKYDGGIQVVMLTGLVTMDSALRAFRLGAATCLFKPINEFDRLIDSLDAAFATLDRWRQVLKELCDRKTDESGVVSS